MKRIKFILCTALLSIAMFSCTKSNQQPEQKSTPVYADQQGKGIVADELVGNWAAYKDAQRTQPYTQTLVHFYCGGFTLGSNSVSNGYAWNSSNKTWEPYIFSECAWSLSACGQTLTFTGDQVQQSWTNSTTQMYTISNYTGSQMELTLANAAPGISIHLYMQKN